MSKTVFMLIIITFFSKLLGFLRDICLSYYYGVSNLTDAYLISITIPTVIFSFIGISISTGYIPLYNNIRYKKGIPEANNFTSNLINVLIIICTILVIIFLTFTSQVVHIFAMGFKGETLKYAITFTRISIISIYFTTIVEIFNGYLQIKGKYVVPALVGFPFNLILIISIILSWKFNIYMLPIGIVVSILFQVIFLVPALIKNEYKHKFIINFKSDNLRKMALITVPLILGVSVNQINVLVDKTIASRIIIGGITSLNYADRINSFVLSTVVMSVSTTIYPVISKMASEQNIKGIKRSVTDAIRLITIILIPASLFISIFSRTIVKLVFARGAFDINALNNTSSVLFYYSIGMLFYGIREVVSKAFYSTQDTKTPMINACIGIVLNIIFSITISKYIGISGLALGSTISALCTTILLLISLRKKFGELEFKENSVFFMKILFSGICMNAIGKIVFSIFSSITYESLALLTTIILSSLSYGILIMVMKVKEVNLIINSIKSRLNKITL